MRYCRVEGRTLPESFHKAMTKLSAMGEVVPCPDYDTEMIECCMDIVVNNPMREPMITRLGIFDFESLQQYLMEISDGILDFMVGADENTWEYTYHQRIGNQIDFVINELKRNPNSRRAVINVRDNEVDQATTHPACLQSIQFLIRKGALDMIVLMRSNDAYNATFMNMFAFIVGIQYKVACELGVPVGAYVHRANSFHVYEKDYEHFKAMIKQIYSKPFSELTYKYKHWQPLMVAEIPKITQKVNDQKKKYNIK